MSKDLPTLMSIKDVMQETGLSRNTIRKAIDNNNLPSKRYGRRRLIRRADFQLWVMPEAENHGALNSPSI